MQTTTNRILSPRVAAIAATLFILLTFLGCPKDSSQEPPQVVAHRGGSLIGPENTLAAFQRGIEVGSDTIELDLHLSSDGELIVIHDPTLERTTGVVGAARLYPKETLLGFDATTSYQGEAVAGDTTIPSFEEVLALAARYPHITLQVEIKVDANKNRYPDIEEKTVAALQRAELLDRVLIISFDLPTLERIKVLEPSLPTGLLVGSSYIRAHKTISAQKIAQEIASAGVDGVGIDYRVLTKKLYTALRKTELLVGVWTVNSKKEMQKHIELGVDFITTDDPPLLLSLL